MLKANYASIFEANESFSSQILTLMSEIALEAEDSTSAEIDAKTATQDTVKDDESSAIEKTNNFQKIYEKIKKLLALIGNIIESLKIKLSNRIRLLNETDKGFFTLYYKRKTMIKPYPNIKVITYEYIDATLEQPIDRIMKEIEDCLNKLQMVEGNTSGNSRITEIITANKSDMIKILLEPYCKNADAENIETIPAFSKYLIERFRGEKREQLFKQEQLPQIEARVTSTKKLSAKCESFMNEAQTSYNKIKIMQSRINHSNKDEEAIQLISENVSRAAILYNALSSLIHLYYELKLEQNLNYRIILRKFYQF